MRESRQASDILSQVQTAHQNFLDWFASIRLVPYDVEFKVYDDEGRVAGTCDFVGEMVWKRGKKTLSGVWYLDWKYVDRVSHGPQIVKYKHMDGRFPKAGAGVVYFAKDALCAPKWFEASKYEQRYLDEFELARKLFYSRHPMMARKAGA